MSTLEIIYLAGFIFMTGVRTYFSLKNKPSKRPDSQSYPGERIFLGLLGVGMILPLFHIWSDWFSFADYKAILPLQWAGMALFYFSIWLLYRSHADLGKNWTPEITILDNHTLVTSGVFKYMRHPMYASHLYWAVALVLIFPNWIVGPFYLLIALLFLPRRIRREEIMMMDKFGEDYQNYRKSTGAMLPKF